MGQHRHLVPLLKVLRDMTIGIQEYAPKTRVLPAQPKVWPDLGLGEQQKLLGFLKYLRHGAQRSPHCHEGHAAAGGQVDQRRLLVRIVSGSSSGLESVNAFVDSSLPAMSSRRNLALKID